MNKITLILIFTSLSILAGDKQLRSYVSAQVTNGDHALHSIGKPSNNTSTGLFANSVNNANVTPHSIDKRSNNASSTTHLS